MCLDNFLPCDLPVLLDREAILTRYAPLVPYTEVLMQTLCAAGCLDKAACLSHSDTALCAITGLDECVLRLFRAFLHLYDFKPRNLVELSAHCPQLCASLPAHGMRTSSDYLIACRQNGLPSLAATLHAEMADVQTLFSLCDLMRLPGVKTVRAELYRRSGFCNLASFANQKAPLLQAQIARAIQAEALPQSIPFLKELRTQIAVATVYTRYRALFASSPYDQKSN